MFIATLSTAILSATMTTAPAPDPASALTGSLPPASIAGQHATAPTTSPAVSTLRLAAGPGDRHERRQDHRENRSDARSDHHENRKDKRDCRGDGLDCRHEANQDSRDDRRERKQDQRDDRQERRS